MKRIGIGGILAAAIVLAGLAAASVAAAAGGPEYLGCNKAAKSGKLFIGKYSEKTCGKEASEAEQIEGKKNKYERGPDKFPVKTSSKFGPFTAYVYDPIEHKLKAEVPCEKGALKGQINNSTEQTLTLSYSGCVIPKEFKNGEKAQFPGPCNTPSQKPGVIVSKPLATKLVWLNEAETEPGILVSAAEPAGTFEEVECFFGKVKIKQTGTILAKIAPKGELTKLLTATFTANSTTGEPELSSYWEGGLAVGAALDSEISAPEFGIFYPAVPTSQTATIPEKSGKVLIG